MGALRLFVFLLASSSALVHGFVVPQVVGQQSSAATLSSKDRPWDKPPPIGQTDNLIFFRLATLLQHWPNTRYPNGHSVVPGTIPIGTTLYHGNPTVYIPTKPDWLAFDPEHATLFTFDVTSRLFTFVTTRPLRVLYFDGSSAAKMRTGTIDTQDLLAWGEIVKNPMPAERFRIADLCAWGKEFGIDGYVRMEMSFEIMYCDFSQGLELVSSLHIVPVGNSTKMPQGQLPPGSPDDKHSSTRPSDPTRPHRPPPIFTPPEPRPPNWKGALTTLESRLFEVFQVGIWHDRAPGEVRVKLDAARMVTLHDPALTSGAEARSGKEKLLYRAKWISSDDIIVWKGWIEDSLRENAPTTSGVDWQALTTVIMDRYGGRLEYLQFLLDPERVSQNATAAIQNVHAQLMLMLVTEITTDSVPTSSDPAQAPQILRETQNYTWAEPIASHCSSFLVSQLPKHKMTREERTLYGAIKGTQAEICRVLTLLWAEAYDPPSTQIEEVLSDWKRRVDMLMEWLDWPMWHRCKPECGVDTMCYIPTWPGLGWLDDEGVDLSKINWTPKCIPRGANIFNV